MNPSIQKGIDQIYADAEIASEELNLETVYELMTKLYGYMQALKDMGFEEWSAERKYAMNRFNDMHQLWKQARWAKRLED